jgi:hypothetical protein
MNAGIDWTRIPGATAAVKMFSATRSALAAVGFAAVLVALLGAALPAPREAMLYQWKALTLAWDAQSGNVSAGTIQGSVVDAAQAREQRVIAEYIAKRYRVSQDAVTGFVASAYRAGGEHKLDPLLILAVVAVESRYNPVAESNMGAKGLMQIIAKFHQEKLLDHGGEPALLVPEVNIQVGAQILREYLRRFGELETALQMYGGAFDEPNSLYAGKVIAERVRLTQAARGLTRTAEAPQASGRILQVGEGAGVGKAHAGPGAVGAEINPRGGSDGLALEKL